MRSGRLNSSFCTSISGEYAAMLMVVFAGFALLKSAFADQSPSWRTPLLGCTVILVTIGQLFESPRSTSASLFVGGLVGSLFLLRLGQTSAAVETGWTMTGLLVLLSASMSIGLFDIARQYWNVLQQEPVKPISISSTQTSQEPEGAR